VVGEHTAFISRRVGKGLQLLVPASEAPTLICTVPVNLEETCGKGFSSHDRSGYEAHVARCIREHEDVIHAAKPSIKRGILHGIWDKDLEVFMEKYADDLREGRKRL
jgi:hypothetical protein